MQFSALSIVVLFLAAMQVSAAAIAASGLRLRQDNSTASSVSDSSIATATSSSSAADSTSSADSSSSSSVDSSSSVAIATSTSSAQSSSSTSIVNGNMQLCATSGSSTAQCGEGNSCIGVPSSLIPGLGVCTVIEEIQIEEVDLEGLFSLFCASNTDCIDTIIPSTCLGLLSAANFIEGLNLPLVSGVVETLITVFSIFEVNEGICVPTLIEGLSI